MKTEILIVSYSKDIPYLTWCLKSIRKFATGFSGVTLVVPENERELFAPLCEIMPFAIRFHDLPGHLGAQTQKCLADIHCPEADFICHLDSDCIFTEPVTPCDYFVNGKPVMLIEEYSRLPGNPWKATVDKALGGDNKWETMRRHPQVNPRGLYADMRHHVESRHGVAFVDYVMSQKPDYPWGYSEHANLGAFALSPPTWKEQYHWIDVGKQPHPHSKLKQYWSLKPPTEMHDLPSGGKARPIDDFERLGL